MAKEVCDSDAPKCSLRANSEHANVTELGELVFVAVIKLIMEGRDCWIEEGPGSDDESFHKRKAEGDVRQRTIGGKAT